MDEDKVNMLLKEPVVLAAIMIPVLMLVGGSMFKDRSTLKKRVVNPTISKDKEKVGSLVKFTSHVQLLTSTSI
jgi:uncharacterized membrane protein YvbJ